MTPKTTRKVIKFAAHFIGTGVFAVLTLLGTIALHNLGVNDRSYDESGSVFFLIVGLGIILLYNFLVDDYATHIDRKRRSEGEPPRRKYKAVN